MKNDAGFALWYVSHISGDPEKKMTTLQIARAAWNASRNPVDPTCECGHLRSVHNWEEVCYMREYCPCTGFREHNDYPG